MLFANGLESFSQALASHPPLYKRIHALDPSFRAADLQKLHTERTEIEQTDAAAAMVSGLANSSGPAVENTSVSPAVTETLLASVGQPDDNHIAAAHSFLENLPATLRTALASADQASLLPLAMLLNPHEQLRHKQISLLTQQLGAERVATIQTLYAELQTFKYEARLPILDLALPVIKNQPAGRISYLADLLEQVALSDNRIEIFEYALLRIYQGYMRHAAKPGGRQRWQNLSARKMKAAAGTLVNVFTQAIASTQGDNAAVEDESWMQAADNALATLNRCTPRGRETVIRALLATALSDGTMHRREAELLRAFCMMLGCPIPPILSAN
jgi:hypothetical protein